MNKMIIEFSSVTIFTKEFLDISQVHIARVINNTLQWQPLTSIISTSRHHLLVESHIIVMLVAVALTEENQYKVTSRVTMEVSWVNRFHQCAVVTLIIKAEAQAQLKT